MTRDELLRVTDVYDLLVVPNDFDERWIREQHEEYDGDPTVWAEYRTFYGETLVRDVPGFPEACWWVESGDRGGVRVHLRRRGVLACTGMMWGDAPGKVLWAIDTLPLSARALEILRLPPLENKETSRIIETHRRFRARSSRAFLVALIGDPEFGAKLIAYMTRDTGLFTKPTLLVRTVEEAARAGLDREELLATHEIVAFLPDASEDGWWRLRRAGADIAQHLDAVGFFGLAESVDVLPDPG